MLMFTKARPARCHCLCRHHCVQESRPGKYLSGDKLTHGDLMAFSYVSVLQSGWLGGETFEPISAT